jgi:hypothetical protein
VGMVVGGAGAVWVAGGEGKECNAPKGSLGGRVALNRRVPTPPQCQIDRLQHNQLILPRATNPNSWICLVTNFMLR